MISFSSMLFLVRIPQTWAYPFREIGKAMDQVRSRGHQLRRGIPAANGLGKKTSVRWSRRCRSKNWGMSPKLSIADPQPQPTCTWSKGCAEQKIGTRLTMGNYLRSPTSTRLSNAKHQRSAETRIRRTNRSRKNRGGW